VLCIRRSYPSPPHRQLVAKRMNDRNIEIFEAPFLRIIGNRPAEWTRPECRAVYYRLVAWLTAGHNNAARSRALSKFHLDMAHRLADNDSDPSTAEGARLKKLRAYERKLYSSDEASLLASGGVENYLNKLKANDTKKKNPIPEELKIVLTAGEVVLLLARMEITTNSSSISVTRCRHFIEKTSKPELYKQPKRIHGALHSHGCIAQLCGAVRWYLTGGGDREFALVSHKFWRRDLSKLLFIAKKLEDLLLESRDSKESFADRNKLIRLPPLDFSGCDQPQLNSLSIETLKKLHEAKDHS